jgi:hypothetical protein
MPEDRRAGKNEERDPHRPRGADYHHFLCARAFDRTERSPDPRKRIPEALTTNLSNRHRDTLERIFSHPSSGNIEWRQVTSLLEAVGAVTEDHAGNLTVTLGGETEVLRRPHGKDVDQQMIVDLRRMLARAGVAAAGR